MRLDEITPEDLTPAQAAVLDAIRGGPRAASGRGPKLTGLVGPYGVWVRAPSVGIEAQALGAAVRFASSLPESVKEAAICTVGAYYGAKFEFAAHRILGLEAGLDPADLEALRVGDTPSFTGDEATAHTVAAELLRDHRLSDATYAAATGAFGEAGLVELVTTVGYYCLISHTLNAFEIPLPADWDDPFPDQA